MRHRATAVIIAGLFVVLGTVVFLVFQLRDSYALIVESARSRNEAIAKIIAARFAAGLQEVDYILRDAADEIRISDLTQTADPGRASQLQAFLGRKLHTHHWIFALRVFNNQGFPVAGSSADGTQSFASQAQANWFLELRDNPKQEFVGSNALEAQPELPLRIVLARKFWIGDSQATGIIAADISLPALQTEFHGFDFVMNGSISLSDSHGILLFHNPALPSLIGTVVKDHDVAHVMQPDTPGLTVVGPSPIDGLQKIIALQRVEGLPYVATMASPLQDDLDPWQHSLLVSTAAFIVITGFVLLFLAAYLRIIRQARELELFATTDELTGLDNRRHFFDRSITEFSQARRYKRALGVLICDLDRFKQVNDTCGHAAGDAVLRLFAKVCQNSIREGDMIGRIGGEEIAIVLHETDAELALLVAERIRKDFELRVQEIGDCSASNATTVSIGVVAIADKYPNFDAILAAADQALYAAKAGGRNRVERAR
jgi:diguanylate cyclase (GGDEF)-like protein